MGRGAFMTWESELVTDSGEVVARRTGTFAYDPAEEGAVTDRLAAAHFEDVVGRRRAAPVELPAPIYRLVVAAGGNRDFNSIHHNSAYAKATGAPDMYASTFFLMGTWERVVRDFIGPRGTIRSINDFRMRKFNLVGTTMTVGGPGDRNVRTMIRGR